MEYTILLDKTANLRDTEAEEQTRFILSTVEALEVPFEWNSNEALTPLDKIRLRKVLSQYNISVIDDMEGGVRIFLERQKIAEFFKSHYLLREDPGQIDPKKKLYIEMKIKVWSIFEEENVN